MQVQEHHLTRKHASQFFVLLAGAASIFCTGCITPWNTQMPSPYAMDPRIENQRMEQFDPFALDDLGPKTFTRQRDYDQPRNKALRAKKAEYSRGFAPSSSLYPSPPGRSIRTRGYQQAVDF